MTDARTGEHLCLRCGWNWDSQPGRPKPPRSCARCHSAYWSVAPRFPARSNRPDDPKWAELEQARQRKNLLARLQRRYDKAAAQLSKAAEEDFRLAVAAPAVAEVEARVEPAIPPPPGWTQPEEPDDDE